MEFIYNNIYKRDNKDCMDISFYFNEEKQERDYVELDNLYNLKIKPAEITYENVAKKTYGIIAIKFYYDLDIENKKIIFKATNDLGDYHEIEFDIQVLADAAAKSIYYYSELDQYLIPEKNAIINEFAFKLFDNDYIVIENHDYNEMFKIDLDNKIIGIGNKICFYSDQEKLYMILDNIVCNTQIDYINSLSMKIYVEKEKYTLAINSFTLIKKVEVALDKNETILNDDSLDRIKIMVDMDNITIEQKSDKKIDFIEADFKNYINILYSKLSLKNKSAANNDTIDDFNGINIFDDLNEL